jgi:hypothetical protein
VKPRFAICLYDSGYANSPLHKVYQVLPKRDADRPEFIRVIDNNQEEYLCPSEDLVVIDLPDEAERALLDSFTPRVLEDEVEDTRKWSRKFAKCQNCGTTRFKHDRRGYCLRCYRLVLRLEHTKRWRFSDPLSSKEWPWDIPRRDPEQFALIKSRVAAQIQERLSLLKAIEEGLERPVDGHKLELLLRYIAERCRTKNKNLFYGIAGYLEDCFDATQRRFIHELLNQIWEDIPWEGIDWYEASKEG